MKLIVQATKKLQDSRILDVRTASELQLMAESIGVTVEQLDESVTHVLANIVNAVDQNQDLKLMSIDSLAAFVAGVEVLSQILPKQQDADKKQRALRVLTAVAVGPDGRITTQAEPIAVLGAKYPDVVERVKQAFRAYVDGIKSGKPANNTQLLNMLRKMQYDVNRAMTIAKAAPSGSTAPRMAPDLAR